MNRPPLITQHPAEYFSALVREALDESIDLASRAQAAGALAEHLWPCLVDIRVAYDRDRERARTAARAQAAARRRHRGEADVVPLFGPNGRW